MVNDDSFGGLFAGLQQSMGRTRVLSVRDALALWDWFVGLVDDGYEMGYAEYLNDMSIRRVLERALDDPRLRRKAEYADLKSRVDAADNRLKAAFRADIRIGQEGDPWWERGVPKVGHDEFAEEMRTLFGVRQPDRD